MSLTLLIIFYPFIQIRVSFLHKNLKKSYKIYIHYKFLNRCKQTSIHQTRTRIIIRRQFNSNIKQRKNRHSIQIQVNKI